MDSLGRGKMTNREMKQNKFGGKKKQKTVRFGANISLT